MENQEIFLFQNFINIKKLCKVYNINIKIVKQLTTEIIQIAINKLNLRLIYFIYLFYFPKNVGTWGRY